MKEDFKGGGRNDDEEEEKETDFWRGRGRWELGIRG